MMNPVDVVDIQLAAYHARDIVAFAATYASDIRVFEAGQEQPAVFGRDALIARYGDIVFKRNGLRAQIEARMVVGNKVIDHELTFWDGLATPLNSVVVYEVIDDLIRTVWFFDPDIATPFDGVD